MTDLRARAAAAANGETDADDERPYRPEDTDHDAMAAIARNGDTLPDLDESPIPAEMDVPVHVAWSRVMGDVQWIGKARATTSGAKYSYRGIDDVKNAVSPVLRRHGVIMLPTRVVPTYEVIRTSSGSAMNFCRVTVTYAVIGPQGDVLPAPIETVGEAFDSGDKAATKAQSVAERIAYVTALSIPTNRPDLDTEHGRQYEIATPKPPTAEEYREEIGRESTSVARLRTIREELNRNPGMANTVVQDVDGTEMTLLKFLVKVGTERAAKGGQQ